MKNKLLLILAFSFLLPLTSFGAIPGKYEVVGKIPKAKSLDVVEIREIFSFTCPHCNDFNKKIPTLKRRFGDKIKIIGHPIAWVGPNPAKLYYVAVLKGVHEEVKDFIFSAVFDSGIQNINDLKILSFIANQFNINKDFQNLIDDPKIEDALKSGKEYAKLKKVTSTPTIIIQDGLKMHGDIENISVIINSLLKQPVKY